MERPNGQLKHIDRDKLRAWFMHAQGGRCKHCRLPMTVVRGRENSITFDHIIPKSKGGKLVWSNVQGLCYRCNQDKGAGRAVVVSVPDREWGE